eukprot:8218155-Heterocapsa_arctica.AAC.1
MSHGNQLDDNKFDKWIERMHSINQHFKQDNTIRAACGRPDLHNHGWHHIQKQEHNDKRWKFRQQCQDYTIGPDRESRDLLAEHIDSLD